MLYGHDRSSTSAPANILRHAATWANRVCGICFSWFWVISRIGYGKELREVNLVDPVKTSEQPIGLERHLHVKVTTRGA